MTRNLLIDHYRRTRQERVTDSIEEQLPMMEEAGAAASARPDQAVAGREASEILQATLQKLSPDLREAVILRDLQEMEYREIAEVLQIPEGTVKSRINRGPGRIGAAAAKAEAGGMNCAELEILICDYVDGTLDAGRKAEVERHLARMPGVRRTGAGFRRRGGIHGARRRCGAAAGTGQRGFCSTRRGARRKPVRRALREWLRAGSEPDAAAQLPWEWR